MQLTDIAHVFAGYHFRGAVRDLPDGTLPVLQVSDFAHGDDFNPAGVKRIQPNFDPEPYLLREGDVLFLGRGHRHWARVTHDVEGMITPGYFYIARTKPDVVHADFLAWWLNHAQTQRRIEAIRRGSNIPFVPLGEFKTLSIQLPPLDTQRRVAEFHQLAIREHEILTKLRDARALVADAFALQAARGVTSQ